MHHTSHLSKIGLRLRLSPATKRNWNPTQRTYSTSPPSRNAWLTGNVLARTTLFTIAAAGSSILLAKSIYADHESSDEKAPPPPPTSLGSLIRAYAVYSMCSVPSLVDASPKILSVLSSVPGVRQVTEAFVRATFFDQFVGADSAEEAIPLLRTMRAANRGVLFAYSVEVDENEATGASISSSSAETVDLPTTSFASSSVGQQHAGPGSESIPKAPPYKRIVDEMIHCIDVAANFEDGVYDRSNGVHGWKETNRGKRTWVAVKMTALLPDAHALIALSSHIVASKSRSKSKFLGSSLPEDAIPFPGAAKIEDLGVLSLASPAPISGDDDAARAPVISASQIRELRELYSNLRRICIKAQERGVKVIVDAEYSWYQPAIDALTLALMREFNSLDKKQSGSALIQPLVYNTFQAYLRRTPQQLSLALADARAHNYALGVKLVRGAYHPHEISAHEAALEFDRAHGAADSSFDRVATMQRRPSLSISPDIEPPVWTEKRDTDERYNACVKVLIEAIKEDVTRSKKRRPSNATDAQLTTMGDISSNFSYLRGRIYSIVGAGSSPVYSISKEEQRTTSMNATPRIGVLFGTHNWDSCALILKELVRNGLGVEEDSGSVSESIGRITVQEEVVERVAIGQLYGMSDDLTDWVVNRISSSTPFVIKYVPYGALADVMPYLSRRAIENKSVLGDGNAQHERDRARQEIKKRIFG
ncbi:Proline dehydrogenase 1, mitochondrial [Psilocybe cubensis]|uniref:Proline dehydrogenase 1, mitochondrial n=2 Tax=Psilocybe cubensis TaxID=181762 RepID=A0ACB8HHY1_PSICU|nr:Proline dehydrogenase 1, mitochondrial [Psilocybe cubensis]KAH9487282.1 Proline dehydrogenase 1, mitochondrial [Psilocybe cubensis]